MPLLVKDKKREPFGSHGRGVACFYRRRRRARRGRPSQIRRLGMIGACSLRSSLRTISRRGSGHDVSVGESRLFHHSRASSGIEFLLLAMAVSQFWLLCIPMALIFYIKSDL